MTEIKLVSIAMATYNGEKHLVEQLNSLLQQDYPLVEIIISDDGSTDSTLSIIETLQSTHTNITCIKNERGKGIKKNFENALRHCNGAYIALCDQDDIWMPEKIKNLVKVIGNHSLVYHNSLFVNEKGESLHKTMSHKMNCYTGSNPEVFLLHNCISGHAAMFHRDLLSVALPFPEARYHDWWLAFVAASRNGVLYLPEVLVHYRQHQSSKTDMLKRKKEFKHLKEFHRYKEELEWFEKCAEKEQYRRPFFANWNRHYAQREHQWVCPWLFKTALQKRKTLYAIPKKGLFGQFLLALKLLWGIKMKKLIG
jgi:glycosyltransferase involved in cell wall biosynthesis